MCAPAQLLDCTVELSAVDGVTVQVSGVVIEGARPTIRRCTIQKNAGSGLVWDTNLGGLPASLEDNKLVANGGAAAKLPPSVVAECVVGTDWTFLGNGINAIVLVPGGGDTPAGAALPPMTYVVGDYMYSLPGLSLQAGTVTKCNLQEQLRLPSLKTSGTAGNPVVFTSLKDDSVGGDTNNDGRTSAPAPGDWKGINIHGDVDLTYCEFRYGDVVLQEDHDEGVAPVNCRLDHCRVVHSAGTGYRARYVSSCTVTGGEFSYNKGDGLVLSEAYGATPGPYSVDGILAVGNEGAPLSLGGGLYVTTSIRDCTFVGNAFDAPGMSSDTLPATTLPKGLHVLTGRVGVATWSDPLTIQPGTIVKFAPGVDAALEGQIIAEGTPEEPIIFTSLHDDTAGGDTDNDAGGNPPQPGDWKRLYALGGSRLSYCRISYGGVDPSPYFGNGSVQSSTGWTESNEFDHCTVSHSKWAGVSVSGPLTRVDSCTIEDCPVGLLDEGRTYAPLSSGCPMVRNSRFFNNTTAAVLCRTSGDDRVRPDLGTAADPGNNVFIGNALNVLQGEDPQMVSARGNYWGTTRGPRSGAAYRRRTWWTTPAGQVARHRCCPRAISPRTSPARTSACRGFSSGWSSHHRRRTPGEP